MNEVQVAPAAAVPKAAGRGWSARRIATLSIGVFLVLVALTLLGAGGTGLWADLTQREAGYVTTGSHQFSTAGSALVTEPTHLGSPGVGWLYSPSILGKVRIRVTPTGTSPVFVGIAHSADVDRYLGGVGHTVISDFFGDKARDVAGGRPGSAPAKQTFWVASSAGSGERTVLWNPSDGSWSVVVMNADARPGLSIKGDLGARIPAVLWIAIGLLLVGAIFLAGGGLLVARAVRGRRPDPAPATASVVETTTNEQEGSNTMFEATARLKIRDGGVEGFKQQVVEIVRLTRESDSQPLRYDWFISDDGTRCEVREAYEDADALVAQQQHVGPAKAKLFHDFVVGHEMAFYGELSPALAGLLEKMGVPYTQFSFLQGLETDVEVRDEVPA